MNFVIRERDFLYKKLLVLFFSVFICLILFEFSVRFLFPNQDGYGYPAGLFVTDNITGYKYAPNFHGFFPNEPYTNISITINSKGLRDYEHDYSREKKKNVRILGLGDSLMFGAGVEYEDSYFRLLEKNLRIDGTDVEIVKMGVNGYNFDQIYNYYFNEGYKYDPDILLLSVVLNDVQKTNVQKLKTDMFDPHESIKEKIINFLYTNSRSAKYILNFIYSLRNNGTYSEVYFKRIHMLWTDDSSWNDYNEKLMDFHEKIRAKDKNLVLVVFPYEQQFFSTEYQDKIPQSRLKNFSTKNNVPLLDFTPVLERTDYKTFYLTGDSVHLNAQGYFLTANETYPLIHSLIENISR